MKPLSQPYSNSYIASFERCHLACFYENEINLRRSDSDASGHHLAFGGAVHKGLEVLYSGGTMQAAQQALQEAYPVQLDPDDLAKTAEHGCFTLEKYWEHYNGDKQWKIIEVVEQRQFRDDGFGIKPDLVVEDENGNLLVVDHKTTGAYLNADYFTQYDPNAQITHYVHWAREKYGHCDGFVVNVLRFAFLKRASKERSAGFCCEFERQVFQRSRTQIQRTLKATEEAIKEIETCRRTGYWRANEQPNACKFCSFRSICAAGWDWENDAELILNNYRRVCNRAVSLTDEHCQLDLDHEGECSSRVQAREEQEILVEI